MSEVRVSMETIRRVYDDDNGCFLEVGPDADALGCVELRCVGKENVEYWGELRLVLPKEFAAKLAEALALCAKEAA